METPDIDQTLRDVQVVVNEMLATSNTSVAIYGKVLKGILESHSGSFQGAVNQILNIGGK